MQDTTVSLTAWLHDCDASEIFVQYSHEPAIESLEI